MRKYLFMTKEELITSLHAPDKAGNAVYDLHGIIENSPYFHTVYQLYVKGLQLTNPEQMELQLSNVALCVRDRALLYDYLNDTESFTRRTMPAPLIPRIPQPKAETQQSKPEVTEIKVEPLKPKVENLKVEEEIPQIKEEIQQIKDIPQPKQNISQPAKKVSAQKNPALDSLIDKFLEASPKIVPNESEFVVDLSDSMKDIKEIGTETLADIYAMQGNKEMAIEIYEQLILKNPEKNIYFAAQIKRLKE